MSTKLHLKTYEGVAQSDMNTECRVDSSTNMHSWFKNTVVISLFVQRDSKMNNKSTK